MFLKMADLCIKIVCVCVCVSEGFAVPHPVYGVL